MTIDENATIMKVAVLCLQGLGDTLMATPMLRLLHEARPDWEIHAVVLRNICAELLQNHPLVKRVHLVPFWDKNAPAALLALPALMVERFDISLLAYPAVRAEYHLLSFLIHAGTRISHNYPPWWRSLSSLESSRVERDEAVHNVRNNVNLLAALDVATTTVPPNYDVPPSWRSSAPRNAVGIHVGSITHKGNENKRWPLEHFVSVAIEIRKMGFDIEFIRGPEEREATDYARTHVPDARVIEGSVAEVARSISGLHALIAGDNGIAHLSAGVGTPTIVLFGLTNPLHVAPWGDNVRIVRPSDCPPCFDFGDSYFGCKRNIEFKCLRSDLLPSHVLEAFAGLRSV